MKTENAIELGKEKVMSGYLSDQIDDLTDKCFEILGYTEADYYGTEEIQELKKNFDQESDSREIKFYQYIDCELVECSFGKAISTPEYEKENIFIFSQLEDEKRRYYVVTIENDD